MVYFREFPNALDLYILHHLGCICVSQSSIIINKSTLHSHFVKQTVIDKEFSGWINPLQLYRYAHYENILFQWFLVNLLLS